MTEKIEKARYFSKLTSLRIVMTPAYTKEVGGRVVTYPGVTLEFKNNYFETEDPEVIAYLDGNDMNDRIYWKLAIDDNLDSVRKAKMEDLEAREKRLAEREKEIAEREQRALGGIHASADDQVNTNARREELMKLTREQLRTELEARKLPVTFNDKSQAVERILASEVPPEENASGEGDGANFE